MQQRIGQINLACALCHDQRAGQRLGGATINEAHPTGCPTYRLEWQALGSLQRRMRGCVVDVRAEPFAADADDWLALEVYLMRRAAGMAMEGVGAAVATKPAPSARLRASFCLHGTRVVCNPRGYAKAGVNENPRFDPDLMIEV